MSDEGSFSDFSYESLLNFFSKNSKADEIIAKELLMTDIISK
jgi:hypothetical protein